MEKYWTNHFAKMGKPVYNARVYNEPIVITESMKEASRSRRKDQQKRKPKE